MIKNKILKKLLLVLALAALAAVSAFYINRDRNHCLGVPFISLQELEEMGGNRRIDLSDDILFMGIPVAADKNNTIYISQALTDDSWHIDLEGFITVKDDKFPIYFVDEGFDSFAANVRAGNPFTLVADTDAGYTLYNVIFTNLPVVDIDGSEESYVKTGETREQQVYASVLSIWNPHHTSTGGYYSDMSKLEWHQRGASTWWDAKKMYKLNLKDDSGENNDLDLLGIDNADDDWMLNAMYRDDTKMREMLAMDLWNGYFAQTDYNYSMAKGEYVELLIDGEYQGVYMLQRRIDAKYLELSEEDVLLKGEKTDEPQTLTQFAAVEQSKYPEDVVWKAVRGICMRDNAQDVRYVNLDNWIDQTLFIDFGDMADNRSRYNNYYIVKNADTTPQVYMTLWDTDFSFGVHYSGGFKHDPATATEEQKYRKEEDLMRELYPDLDKMLAQRWFSLREGVLSEENIFAVIAENYSTINFSGAFDRDKSVWENFYYGDTDTVEALYKYISDRLEYLDGQHEKFMQ